MPEEYAPGRVSPYSRPQCPAVYRGVMSPTPLRCGRREHRGTDWWANVHQADLPALPGTDQLRTASWL